MKLYTDFSGKFQMYIPIDWEYKNPYMYNKIDAGRTQAFGKIGRLLGAFQISCNQINEHIAKLIKDRNEPIQSSQADELIFSELKIVPDKKDEFYMFSCAVDDHYFLATYVIPVNKKHLSIIKTEIKEVKKILSTIKFIRPEFRSQVVAFKRFDLFMSAIAATIDLKNKAIQNNSFIEFVVLTANSIDALLRLSIILSNQIKNNNNEIDTTLLFQNEEDTPIMERKIYKMVLEKEIVSQEIYKELERLYRERNKVIHRYIITDIRTEDVYNIGIRYDELGRKIDCIINNLEQKQFDLKVGVHANNLNLGKGISEIALKELISNVRAKHGNVKIDVFDRKIQNKQ